MERIDESVPVDVAQMNVKTNTLNGIILGYCEEEIIVRHENAVYVCQPHKRNKKGQIIATTLNHYMKNKSLTSLEKIGINQFNHKTVK